jgi:hypothetical protein
MAKKILFTTAKGIAKYPHITERDTGHQYSSGKYDTQIILTKEAAAPLVAELKAVLKSELPGLKDPKVPYKTDDEGNVIFKAKSEYQPVIVDARGKKMEKVPATLRIRGGSTIRIAGTVNAYDKGVSLWLNQVQIIDLVEDNVAFEADEGGQFSADDYDGDDSASEMTSSDAPAL